MRKNLCKMFLVISVNYLIILGNVACMDDCFSAYICSEIMPLENDKGNSHIRPYSYDTSSFNISL